MSGDTNGERTLAQRLGSVRVAARPDLRGSRHVFGGDVAYVLQDPITFESHRLAECDYRILTALRTDQTLAETFRDLVDRGSLADTSEDQFYRFVANLQQRGLLNVPFANGQRLYARHEQRRLQPRRRGWLRLMVLPVPLLNPDAFLERTQFVGRWLFSRVAFGAWLLLMLLCGAVLFRRWEAFTDPLGSILATQHLPWLLAAFAGLKVLHEFGHAYACKRFGGYVPDMGILLVLLNPCAYVDCSAAWGFPSRWHRIIVSLAGMYVESIVAAGALLIWNVTGPSTGNSLAHHVVVTAGFVTVVFNLNPLLKYDGYFVLCDLIGMPNLKQRATDQLLAYVKRYGLGMSAVEVGWSRRHILLATYGLLSSIYRLIVVVSMSAYIATKLLVAGIALAALYFLTTIVGLVRRSCRYLWCSEETAPVRGRAIAISAAVLVGLPVLAGFLPVPRGSRITGTVAMAEEEIVRVKHGGIVRDIATIAGSSVTRETRLLTLENLDLESQRQRHAADLRRATREYLAAQAADHVQVSQALQQVSFQRQKLDKSRRDVGELHVSAAQPGVLLQCLSPREVGQFLPAGSPVAVVGHGSWIVRAIADADQLRDALPEVGQTVACRLVGSPAEALVGRITTIAPTGSRTLALDSLTQLGGGSVVVNEQTRMAATAYFELTIELVARPPGPPQVTSPRRGATAIVALHQHYDPLAAFLFRRGLRFWNNLILNRKE